MIIGTVEGIEAWWIGLGFPVMLLLVWALVDAVFDDRERERNGRNGLLRMATRANIVRASALCIIQGLLLAIGVEAVYLPAPPPHTLTFAEVLFDVAMFGVQALVGLFAIFDRIVRRRMIAYDVQPATQ